MSLSPGSAAAIARARRAERVQALFYRGLAAQAEAAGDAVQSDRLNGLHADEQHQLSRLTARLLELGHALEDLREVRPAAIPLENWEDVAREREAEEVRTYEELMEFSLDDATRALVDECLRVEREHARTLTGKWMSA